MTGVHTGCRNRNRYTYAGSSPNKKWMWDQDFAIYACYYRGSTVSKTEQYERDKISERNSKDVMGQ